MEFTIARFGPSQARRVRDALEQTLRRLLESPGLGRTNPELDPPGHTFRYYVLLRTFVIVYEPVPDGIRVARLLPGARDVAAELGGDFGR